MMAPEKSGYLSSIYLIFIKLMCSPEQPPFIQFFTEKTATLVAVLQHCCQCL